MSRGFFGQWMHDFNVLNRWCVRVWHRRGAPSWRPYFSRRYCVAAFGAGPLGVQIMRYLSREEFAKYGAPADSPALLNGQFAAARPTPERPGEPK